MLNKWDELYPLSLLQKRILEVGEKTWQESIKLESKREIQTCKEILNRGWNKINYLEWLPHLPKKELKAYLLIPQRNK